MRLRRLVTVLANGAACLLLGLAGVAVAAPAIQFPDISLYGPLLFSSSFETLAVFSSDTVWLLTSNLLVNTFDYVTPAVSNVLDLLGEHTEPLLSAGITQVVLLPSSDSIFAAVPEPIGLSLLAIGVAGVSFLRRRRQRNG